LAIAHGTIGEYESWENNRNDRGWYVNYIWEAKNLNSWKKFVVGVRYLATLPFTKYLQCISPLLDSVHAIWVKVDDICGPYIFTPRGPIFLFLWFFILYVFTGLVFHIITLPFHASALSLELFALEKNHFSLFTHCGLRIFLFLPYSLFFPPFIDGFLINDFVNEGNYNKIIKLNTLNTEPKNKMWSFSFLIPRKRPIEFYIWFVFCEMFLSLILKFGFKNWIPL